LGFGLDQLLQETGGVTVVLEKAFQNPAHREFQIEELWWWLMKVLFDVCEAGA
jgi:hypothetical protein